MENQTQDKRLYIFTSGAILGLAMVLFLSIVYLLTGRLSGTSLDALSWLIYAGVIYYTMRRYRDHYMDGFISYGKGLVFGMQTAVLSGLIIGFFFFIMFRFINPGLQLQLVQEAEEAYLALGMSEAFVEQMSASIEMMSNPWVLLISNAFSGLINGLLVALIISMFVKRKGDPFQEVMKDV